MEYQQALLQRQQAVEDRQLERSGQTRELGILSQSSPLVNPEVIEQQLQDLERTLEIEELRLNTQRDMMELQAENAELVRQGLISEDQALVIEQAAAAIRL